MRYYEFVLNANAKYIKENARINLREYDFSDAVAAMNFYMHRNIGNGIYYFAYREEEGCLCAAFSHNERAVAFDKAYNMILEMLRDALQINKVKTAPEEITMFRFLDCIKEGQRRGVVHFNRSMEEASNMFLYETMYRVDSPLLYDLEERIIPEKKKEINGMYDQSFLDELSNIEAHKNIAGLEGNMVHYVISGKSLEVSVEMTEVLVQRLKEAGRVSGKRMEIIRNIDPDMHCKKNYLEDFIENNYGGVIVVDLSEKFGKNPVDYDMTVRYIDGIVKRYKNDCLFVFSYNREKPGFAYQLLPLIRKHVIMVMLREGTGDRQEAVKCLRGLIEHSNYSAYAYQAGEFMELFHADSFSQTDVLAAYEKFEPWCLNRNVFKAYNYDLSETFMLDREDDDGSSCEKLEKMVGLAGVKKQIQDIIAADIVEKERKKRMGNAYESGTMHMIFAGNPGTAKTTVAKLFAGIAKDKGILKSGAFVEWGGMDLDGLGCVMAIRRAFEAANGGVLFIDEAYSMKSDTAVTVLIQEMEARREEVIVILAGYDERIREFMEINEGMKSRVPYRIDFPDYSVDELMDIFKLMIKDRAFSVTEDAVKEAHSIFEKARFMDNFGNGRYVRNVIDHAIQKQSVRLLAKEERAESIKGEDLFLLVREDIHAPDAASAEERPAGTASKELEEMTGLDCVKKVIHKAVASFKVKRFCEDRGIYKDRASMHMVFTGNPGTAKTTVARLFAEILKDEKVLPSGVFVETGRADLVGDHVGATAKLVRKKFKEAQGGILFIDEAYALCDNYSGGYGDEAINTIVQEMENHRDEVIVIFAGYPEPMDKFLERNPGMASRIAFRVAFEDYTTEDLCDITKLMAAKKQLTVTDAAMEKLRSIYEDVRKEPDYGNGRFVRRLLEEAEMNLAQRLAAMEESMLTAAQLTTIEAADIPQETDNKRFTKTQIGFCTL